MYTNFVIRNMKKCKSSAPVQPFRAVPFGIESGSDHKNLKPSLDKYLDPIKKKMDPIGKLDSTFNNVD